MSSDTGLLKDICANPDDDTPRLVYADWLDDHGDAEGAEFIRLQIRLSKMPAGDRRRAAAERRERELWAGLEEGWFGPFRNRKWLHKPTLAPTPARPAWAFRRGFLERVTLSVEGFRKHGKKLLAAAPVREAWFPDCEGEDLAALGEIETLSRLTALDLAGANYTGGTEELLFSDNVAGLRRLDFCCAIQDDGMGGGVWGPLVSSETLANLRELLLTNHPMDADTFDLVVRRFRLPALRKLGLEGVPRIDRTTARKLAGAKPLEKLEVLAVTRENLLPGSEAILRERFGAGLLINDLDTHAEGWRPCF